MKNWIGLNRTKVNKYHVLMMGEQNTFPLEGIFDNRSILVVPVSQLTLLFLGLGTGFMMFDCQKVYQMKTQLVSSTHKLKISKLQSGMDNRIIDIPDV